MAQSQAMGIAGPPAEWHSFRRPGRAPVTVAFLQVGAYSLDGMRWFAPIPYLALGYAPSVAYVDLPAEGPEVVFHEKPAGVAFLPFGARLSEFTPPTNAVEVSNLPAPVRRRVANPLAAKGSVAVSPEGGAELTIPRDLVVELLVCGCDVRMRTPDLAEVALPAGYVVQIDTRAIGELVVEFSPRVAGENGAVTWLTTEEAA